MHPSTHPYPDLFLPLQDPALDAIHRKVLDDPADDTTRLVYADYLDDRGMPGDAERAGFIRLGIERHLLGKPRLVVERAVLSTHGPDYFGCMLDDETVGVGDRVDVEEEEFRVHGRLRRRKRTHHGLLVTRVTRDVSGFGIEAVLKRDEQSVPWPRGRAKELDDRCASLLGSLGPAAHRVAPEILRGWGSGPPPPPPPYGGGWLVFARGFPAAVHCRWSWWAEHGSRLFDAEPVTRVCLEDGPPYEEMADPQGDPYEFPVPLVWALLTRQWPRVAEANWSWPGSGSGG